MAKFYFKSYNMIIGEASNVSELAREIRRLSIQFPMAVEYHLQRGHVVQWLTSIGEIETAEKMKGVQDIAEALYILEKQIELAVTVQRMTRGRMH